MSDSEWTSISSCIKYPVRFNPLLFFQYANIEKIQQHGHFGNCEFFDFNTRSTIPHPERCANLVQNFPFGKVSLYAEIASETDNYSSAQIGQLFPFKLVEQYLSNKDIVNLKRTSKAVECVIQPYFEQRKVERQGELGQNVDVDNLPEEQVQFFFILIKLSNFYFRRRTICLLTKFLRVILNAWK